MSTKVLKNTLKGPFPSTLKKEKSLPARHNHRLQ